jgi:hypothetical protein
MKALKVDENGFKWSKWMNLWRQECFFWVQILPKIGQRLKKFAFWQNFASKKMLVQSEQFDCHEEG